MDLPFESLLVDPELPCGVGAPPGYDVPPFGPEDGPPPECVGGIAPGGIVLGGAPILFLRFYL